MIKNKKIVIILGICLLLTTATSYSVFAFVNNDDNNNKDEFIKQLNITEDRNIHINELKEKGYTETNIYTGYAFLCERYGTLKDLENMLEQKSNNKSWESIFKEYDKSHEKFEPRKFEPDYIDKLIMAEVSADDIMICDKIAWKSEQEFEKLMNEHMEGIGFAELANRFGIISNEQKLLRVKVSETDLDKYINKYNFTREQIFKYCVLAEKIGQERSVLMDKINKGINEYSILEDYYEEIFK